MHPHFNGAGGMDISLRHREDEELLLRPAGDSNLLRPSKNSGFVHETQVTERGVSMFRKASDFLGGELDKLLRSLAVRRSRLGCLFWFQAKAR